MLTIYGIPTPNTAKVVLTAEQLELPYDYVPVDMSKQEHKSPEHLARHPLGKVPAIDHDGRSLCESNAICVYLCQLQDSPLYTGDAYQKARIHQWIDMMSFHMGRWLGVYYFENFVKPKMLNSSPDQSQLEEADGFLKQQLPVLDRELTEHEFLCGTDLTLADLVGFVLVNSHEVSGFDIGPYPAISRWHDQLKGLPAYGRAQEALGL